MEMPDAGKDAADRCPLSGGLCCKTILTMWARNIDSRSRTAKQLRFKSALAPIRLFQNPIPQLLYGDFCNTIDPKRTLPLGWPASEGKPDIEQISPRWPSLTH
jgi:hypothetical protein